MKRWSWFAALVLCFAPGCWLAGCDQPLNADPVFKEHVKLVNSLKEELSDTNRRLPSMDAELQAVSNDVKRLKAGGLAPAAGGGDAFKALEARVLNLENALKSANAQLVALQQGKPRSEEQAQAAPDDESEAQTEAKPAEASPAPAAKLQAKPKRIRVRAAASSAAPPRMRVAGTYHKMQANETIQAIAAARRISVQEILVANRLPSSAQLMPGQQIYIPGR